MSLVSDGSDKAGLATSAGSIKEVIAREAVELKLEDNISEDNISEEF
jgi:hypothetical protein